MKNSIWIAGATFIAFSSHALSQENREPNTDLIISVDNPALPNTLSDFPELFQAASGDGESIPGVVYYEPSSILYSDNAHKERYLAIPGTEQMGYTEGIGFDMPEGTIVVKNFLLPIDERDPEGSLQRIETRVMLYQNDAWEFATYEWNDSETDATRVSQLSGNERDFTLTDPNGNPFSYTWEYPSSLECLQCHTPAANYTLGINTAALNSEIVDPLTQETKNQFQSLRDLGYFADAPNDPVEELPALADYTDESESLERRFKGYVAANCAMCHRPGGGTPVSDMDLRWETPLASMNIIDVNTSRSDLGIPDAKRIDSAQPENSILYLRMNTNDDQIQMPPIARNRIDEPSVDLVLEWIQSIQGGNSSDLFVIH